MNSERLGSDPGPFCVVARYSLLRPSVLRLEGDSFKWIPVEAMRTSLFSNGQSAAPTLGIALAHSPASPRRASINSLIRA